MGGRTKFKLVRALDRSLSKCALLLFLSSLGWIAECTDLRLTTLLGGKWPDYVSGQPSMVTVDGHYAYVGLRTGGLIIFDISNPANIVRVGEFESGPSGGGAGDVAVAGGYAYFAGSDTGVHVLSITNPATPTRVAWIDTTNSRVDRLALSGDLLFLAGFDRLDVYSVMNPAAPERVGSCIVPYGWPSSIKVSGGFAYVGNDSFIHILAVTNPASPTLISQVGAPARDLALSRGYAFAAGADGILRVISVTNPAAPVWVTGHTNPGNGIYAVCASSNSVGWTCGTHFYLASISDSSPLSLTGSCEARAGVTGIAMSDGYAFLANTYSGLQMVAITNLSNPQVVGGHRTGKAAQKVAVSGDYAYVATYDADLPVVAVWNPAAPVAAGEYAPTNYQYGRAVHVAGDYVYYLSSDEFTILSITNPAAPTKVGSYPLGANGVAMAGNHAFLAAGGLTILDVSNPSAPEAVGSVGWTNGSAQAVAVEGNYAYTAHGSAGLQVFSIADKSNPVRVGGYQTGGYATGIAVSNKVAYVAARSLGVQILSVTNPANPVLLASYSPKDDTFHDSWDVTLSGSYAFVADNSYGLRVLGVTDPTAPVEVCTLPVPEVMGVCVAGSRIHLASARLGLVTYCTVPQIQFMGWVENGTAGLPLTVEYSTNFTGNTTWTPLFTTNCPARPFDFCDPDTTASRRFYRIRQPAN